MPDLNNYSATLTVYKIPHLLNRRHTKVNCGEVRIPVQHSYHSQANKRREELTHRVGTSDYSPTLWCLLHMTILR